MGLFRKTYMATVLGAALAVCAAGAGAAGNSVATDPDAGASKRVVRNGVVVEFTATPVASATKGLMEGELADVRFRITSEATGQPVRGVAPGAWMDMAQVLQGGEGAVQKSCKDKISLYLKGAVGIRPMLDLNSYFVVLMNREPSLTVVDPVVSMVGSTSTLASIPLASPGGDFVAAGEQHRLFVSLPGAGKVAVVDTDSFRSVGDVSAGRNPLRVALQPDGRYLWVGNDAAKPEESGVTVIDTETLKRVGFVRTGTGHHEIAFSADSLHAFVTNRGDGTLSVVKTATLAKVKDIKVGASALSVGYSKLSNTLFVSDGKEGHIAVIDAARLEEVKRVRAKSGLGPLRVTPDGRFAMAVNTAENAVFVVDASTNELVNTVKVQGAPYQITFSDAYAYVRALDSERVSLIALATLGAGRQPTVQSFAAGADAPRRAGELAIADSVTTASSENSILVVNPVDGTTYYYMEGMNAPSSNYKVRGSSAKAVLVVDHSMKELEPGVYGGRVKVPAAGHYDVAFMMDSPQLLHCFAADAAVNPKLARTGVVTVDYQQAPREALAGETLKLRFRVFDSVSNAPRLGLKDVQVMYFLAPGRNRSVVPAKEVGGGVYEAEVPIGTAGAYYLYVGVPSLNKKFGELPFFSLRAKQSGSTAGGGSRPGEG